MNIRYGRSTNMNRKVQKVQIVKASKPRRTNIPLGIELYKRVKLGYSEIFSLTSTVGAYIEQIFNMNSIFDPDYTFTGHQAYLRDTYATIYSKYRVLNFKYQIDVAGQTGSNPTWFGILPNQNLSTVGSMSLLAESPFAKSVIVTTGQKERLSGSIDLAKLTGRTHAEYKADDIYSALMTTNPAELMGFHVGLQSGTAVNSVVIFKIRIVFDVVLFDPVQQAQS